MIWLTPDLFSELGLIARTKGGCVIEVKDEEEMNGFLAGYIFLAGDIDFNRHTKRYHTMTLSNRIDVEQFQRQVKPEMDFGEIPRDQIYHFACELRADRYAWKSLFPGQPLPKRKGSESTVRNLDAFIGDN